MSSAPTQLQVKSVHPDRDESIPTKVLEWWGTEDVRLATRGKPLVTEPKDAILKITATTVCGSDLHMYTNTVQGLEKGDVLGHEFMGIIDSVGSAVTNFKPGDRVVASFDIACGDCEFCKKEKYSLCDATNPSTECEKLLGGKLCGAYGYTHLTGGYDGGQAEYVRVPIADFNLLKVPDNVPDEKALYLSDIVCTSYHANVLGRVKPGKTVAVWGCGPVGLLAQAWAKFLGASVVIGIDNLEYRLQVARDKIGSHTINFDEVSDVVGELKKLIPGGPDVSIDAAGFRFPKTLSHKLQHAVKLENDSLDIVNEMILATKKGGHISIVGDYFGYGNQFPIGPLMEKSLTIRGGQCFVQKYWHELLGHIESGKFDPTIVVTHHMTLEDLPEAYRKFNNREDNCIKVFLKVGE